MLIISSKNNSGFTLIEVLISSVILFSALAITAELYSASSLTSKKINRKAHFYQISPVAISAIKSEIRTLSENRRLSVFSSSLNISGILYTWKAERVSFKARAKDINDLKSPLPQFGLFVVNVIAQENTVESKITEFQFKVATW